MRSAIKSRQVVLLVAAAKNLGYASIFACTVTCRRVDGCTLEQRVKLCVTICYDRGAFVLVLR